jgi:hypothetical protein
MSGIALSFSSLLRIERGLGSALFCGGERSTGLGEQTVEHLVEVICGDLHSKCVGDVCTHARRGFPLHGVAGTVDEFLR